MHVFFFKRKTKLLFKIFSSYFASHVDTFAVLQDAFNMHFVEYLIKLVVVGFANFTFIFCLLVYKFNALAHSIATQNASQKNVKQKKNKMKDE